MSDPVRIVACPNCAMLNRVPAAKLGAGGKCGRCHEALFQHHPLNLTSRNFEAHALKSDLPLLIDFWAGWCGPCRQMAPAFEAAAAHLEPEVRLGKVDTEAEPSIAGRFSIRSIPTIVLLLQGKELARQSGVLTTQTIVEWVKRVLRPMGNRQSC